MFSSCWNGGECFTAAANSLNLLNFISETHDCKDREKSRCPRLKEEGYCESTNPNERLTMRINCALTCNFCSKQHFLCRPGKGNSLFSTGGVVPGAHGSLNSKLVFQHSLECFIKFLISQLQRTASIYHGNNLTSTSVPFSFTIFFSVKF